MGGGGQRCCLLLWRWRIGRGTRLVRRGGRLPACLRCLSLDGQPAAEVVKQRLGKILLFLDRLLVLVGPGPQRVENLGPPRVSATRMLQPGGAQSASSPTKPPPTHLRRQVKHSVLCVARTHPREHEGEQPQARVASRGI